MHTQPVLDANRSQTTQSSGSQRRAWGMTGLLLALTVINQADQAVFGIIAQPVAKELGLSSSQLGLVGSLFYAALSIGGLMAGVINRWISLKWALVILALIWSITALPLVVSASLATLIAFRLLLGLTEGPSVPLASTGQAWCGRSMPTGILCLHEIRRHSGTRLRQRDLGLAYSDPVHRGCRGSLVWDLGRRLVRRPPRSQHIL